MVEWNEELPELCPPSDAIVPENIIVYRFCRELNPTEDDFISHRKLWPDKRFDGVDECLARSLSVIDDLEICKNRLKLPRMKNFNSIYEVRLGVNDGLIKKTFPDPNHYSWWRAKSFIIDNIVKVE